MELEITRLFTEEASDAGRYSASVVELGNDAGRITWDNATECGTGYPELTDTEEKRQAMRDHFAGFGAWSDDEIAAWSDNELAALFIQLLAGDVRELSVCTDETDPLEMLRDTEGRDDISGRLFIGDDEKVYYYLGD